MKNYPSSAMATLGSVYQGFVGADCFFTLCAAIFPIEGNRRFYEGAGTPALDGYGLSAYTVCL